MYNFDRFINQLIEDKEIPAAVLKIKKEGNTVFEKAYGGFTNNNDQEIRTQINTIFDLASLTKVMATLPAILLLMQNKELELDDKVQKYLPLFKHKDVTIKDLLQHISGLNADAKDKRRVVSNKIINTILALDKMKNPKNKVQYSDLGMILLGEIVREITGIRLNDFCNKYLFRPWRLNDTCYLPMSHFNIERIAATETYQGEYIHGVVHDEKAFQLGGVSGSAGLFSTAEDVSRYLDYWLYPETQNVLLEESMKTSFQNIIENRGLGFEVWTGKGEELSCSEMWGNGSFGHTGFTGTSAWADPNEKLTVVFLSNIVHFGRNHRLPEIRKKLHALIFKEFAVE